MVYGLDVTMERKPIISIIVPMYNVEKTILKCLEGISKLDYPKKNLEIILSDDASTDETVKHCEEFICNASEYREILILIPEKNEGVSTTRNRGIENSYGEFIAFVDADIVVEQDFLNRMLEHFQDERVGGVAAVCPFENKDIITKYYDSFKSSNQRILKNIELGTGATIYRSEVTGKIRFDERIRLPSLEDADFALSSMKLGYETLQDNSIKTLHIRETSLRKEIKIIYRKGLILPLILTKHSDKKKKHTKSIMLQLFSVFSMMLIPLSLQSPLVLLPFLTVCNIYYYKSFKSLRKNKIFYSFIGLLLSLSHSIGLFMGIIKWRKKLLEKF